MDPLTLIGLVTGVGGTVIKGLPMIALVGGGLMLMTGHGDDLGEWGKGALNGIADLADSLLGEDNPISKVLRDLTGKVTEKDMVVGMKGKEVSEGDIQHNENTDTANQALKESIVADSKSDLFGSGELLGIFNGRSNYADPISGKAQVEADAELIGQKMVDKGFYIEGKTKEESKEIFAQKWLDSNDHATGLIGFGKNVVTSVVDFVTQSDQERDKTMENFQENILEDDSIRFDLDQASRNQDIEDVIGKTVYENDEHMDSEANKKAIIQGLKERGVYRTNPDGTRSEISEEELSEIIDKASDEQRGGFKFAYIGPRVLENSYDTDEEELEAKTNALISELNAKGIYLEDIKAGEPKPEYEELSSGEEALQEKNEAAHERANEKPEVNPEPEYEELSSGDAALQEKNKSAHNRANEKPAASLEPEYKELSSEDKALQEKNNAAHERANVAQKTTTAQKSEEKSGPVDVGSGKEVESVKNRVVHTQADTKNVVKEDVVESVIEKEKPKGKEEKAEEKEKAPSLKDIAGKVSSDIAKKSGQYAGKDNAGSMNDLIGNATKLAGKKSVEVAIDVAKKQLAYGEPENAQMR